MSWLGNIKSSFEKWATDQINFLVAENTKRMLVIPAKYTTSGTSVDFSSADGTGIPSWAKRITVMLNGVSTTGTSNILVQLGAGSIQSSGYVGSVSAGTSLLNFSTGQLLTVGIAAAAAIGGHALLSLVGSSTWSMSSAVGFNNASLTALSGGNVTLSGALDRIRLTTANGTDTFDTGSVSLLIEG